MAAGKHTDAFGWLAVGCIFVQGNVFTELASQYSMDYRSWSWNHNLFTADPLENGAFDGYGKLGADASIDDILVVHAYAICYGHDKHTVSVLGLDAYGNKSRHQTRIQAEEHGAMAATLSSRMDHTA